MGGMGTSIRLVPIAIGSVNFICDNSVAIMAIVRGLTMGVLHRTESDFDIIATIKYLEKERCHDIEVTYQWVKGHVDHVKH
jgi:hypothetical protein